MKVDPEALPDGDAPTARLEVTERIELGQWYWVSHLNQRPKLNDFDVLDERLARAEGGLTAISEEEEPEPPPSKWLACVTEIGTNYALLTAPNDRDHHGLRVL